MVLGRRRAGLRVGLGAGLAEVATGTGHGNVWARGLEELAKLEGVELVDGRRADVWLASGHAPPPAGRPLVVHVHEISWRDPALRAFLHPGFADQIEADTAASVAAADHVISLSDSTRAQVLEAYDVGEERVHTVHPGVDHDLFRPGLEGGRRLVARALGTSGEVPYVLYVGVLHPRKNYAALRAAVADLAARGLPHVLAMVGNLAMDHSDGPAYEREAAAPLRGLPDRLVRLANVDDQDLARLTAGADAFCLPSFYEGFGLPALEAMACGTPAVVSDRGSLPEVVGDAAVVIEPTAEALADALHRVLTDAGLADELRRAGPERARGFSWPRTARGWLRVVELAAGRQ